MKCSSQKKIIKLQLYKEKKKKIIIYSMNLLHASLTIFKKKKKQQLFPRSRNYT